MMLKKLILLAIILLVPVAASSQPIPEILIDPAITRNSQIIPTGEANAICVSNTGTPAPSFTLCSTLALTGKTVLYKIPEFAFASIPAGSPLVVVNNSSSPFSCDGGGSSKSPCWFDGATWQPLLGGGGGGGSGTLTEVVAGLGLAGGGLGPIVTVEIDPAHPHEANAGVPAAGSCLAKGQIIIDEVTAEGGITGVPYWCNQVGSNPVKFSATGSQYSGISDGANASNVDGSETLRMSAMSGISFRVFNGTGTFTNQPANDAVEIISSSASDVQVATIWGTTFGTQIVTTEAITLTGTSVATTVKTDWGNILAIELASAAVGTVTFREASGNATITTIAAGNTLASTLDQVIAVLRKNVGGQVDPPSATDDSSNGFEKFSLWGTTSGEIYIAVDVTVGAAVWQLLGSGTGGSIGPTSPPFRILGATETEPFEICNANGTICEKIYFDDLLGSIVGKTVPVADRRVTIPTDKNGCWFDEEGDSCVELIDPDSATKKGIYTYQTAYKPLDSEFISARMFSSDGTQCANVAEAALNTNKPKVWSITCTDNDAGRITATWTAPEKWDGGTIRIRPRWFITTASTGNIVQSWSGQCVRDGDPVADVATTGEQNVTLTFQNEANEEQMAYTPAITLQGTCAAGASIFLTGDIDATGSTSVMSNARFLGAGIEYSVTSRSD